MKYHGIVLDVEFVDTEYLKTFKVFARRESKVNPWTLYGIEVDESQIGEVISSIQGEMRSDKPYYAHLYNDDELIVIFKEKVFKVTPHKSTWDEIINFGRQKGIPNEQLDFWPNRFQDEVHYFDKKDLYSSSLQD